MFHILCKTLGIKDPVILGGLARIGTALLVAVVSNAGGLGILGAMRSCRGFQTGWVGSDRNFPLAYKCSK